MAIRSGIKNANKTGGKRRAGTLLTQTVISATTQPEEKPKRGVKVHSPELKRLVEMANLAGERYLFHDHFKREAFDSISGLLSAIMLLDDPLRSHLLEVMSWPEQLDSFEADLVKAIQELHIPGPLEAFSKAQVVDGRYQLIRGAVNMLKMVVEEHWSFPAAVFLVRDEDESGKQKSTLRRR